MIETSIVECPRCQSKFRIVDTWAKENYVKRKRKCEGCGLIAHTIETHEINVPSISATENTRPHR